MEYLGHTQSANYTFGPWRSPAFRLSPFLPAVNSQPQQQRQPPWQRSSPPNTAVNLRIPTYHQLEQKQDYQQLSSLTNGQFQPHQYQRGITSVNGGDISQLNGRNLTRSKTCIDLGVSNDAGGQFNFSYRPSAVDDLPSRDRFLHQNGCLTSRPFSTSGTAAAANGYGGLTNRSPTNGVGGNGSGGGAPTAADWASWTRAELTAADRARSGSELVRADVLTLCRDATDRTRRTQADTTRRLGDRVQDVKFWRDEVRKEMERADAEKVALQKATNSLERALDDTAEPLRIAEECLRLRQQKIESNLVHDEVERELLKEIDQLRAFQDQMANMLREVKAVAINNEPLRATLVQDAAEKQEALRLDRSSHQLRQTSQGLQLYTGIENSDNTITDTESWTRHTDDLISKSQADRAMSADARSRVDDMLGRSATAILMQWNTVNSTLGDRVCDYIDARNKLQTNLAKVLQEMVELDKSAELLRKTIRDKEAPLMLAQTRLATRIPRPNMESCRDQAQDRLVGEVHEIQTIVDQLNNKLRDIDSSMRSLHGTRLALERDLTIKNNSIHVDRDLCLSWRKSFDLKPRSSVTY